MLLSLLGCTHLPRAGASLPPPSVSLMEGWFLPPPAFTSREGSASARVSWLGLTGGAEASFRQAGGGDFRLELRAPFGATLLAASLQGDSLIVWNLLQGQVFTTDQVNTLLRERSSGWLDAPGLACLIAGRLPPSLRPLPETLAAGYRFSSGKVEYRWPVGGEEVAVVMEDGGPLLSLSFAGRFTVTWSDWQSDPSCPLPKGVTVHSQGGDRIAIAAFRLSCGEKADERDLATLTPDPSIPRQSLEELLP